ncbi:methyl-accepting chemotaxis protein, partial [Paraburkholderia phymatum]
VAAFCRNQPSASLLAPRASSVRFAGLTPALDPATTHSRFERSEIKDLIGNSNARVEVGAKLVDEAGQTMAELIESVSRAHSIMGEISEASQEQSRGLDQVNVAVNEMDRAVQQNAALVEQAAAAAHSLQEQTELLADTAAKFQVRDRKRVPLRASER